MMKVHECAEGLVALTDAYLAGDGERVPALVADVVRLEEEADAIKREIREELSHSMFTAVQRAEVINLLKAQDDVADDCLEVAQWMEVRPTHVPDSLASALRGLCGKVVATSEALAETTKRLRATLESAVAGTSEAETSASAEAVRTARHDVEREAHEVMKRVFAFEAELGGVGVFALAQIVSDLSKAAESAENAADCIARLIIHR
jgi:uncharacterized protein